MINFLEKGNFPEKKQLSSWQKFFADPSENSSLLV